VSVVAVPGSILAKAQYRASSRDDAGGGGAGGAILDSLFFPAAMDGGRENGL